MPAKQKRTYNLAPATVRAVRELADDYHAARTQDGVIELAVDELRRRIRDAVEAAAWERAAADPAFRAEVEAIDADLPVTDPGDLAGMTTGPLRWAVVVVGLDPAEGHEQAGKRRVLVVSYEPFHRSGLMTVCPISAARAESRYPGRWRFLRVRPGRRSQESSCAASSAP